MAKLKRWFPWHAGRVDDKALRCPAVIFRGTASSKCAPTCRDAIRFCPMRRCVAWCSAHGTMAADDARRCTQSRRRWGACFGADLTEREVDWLVRTEWATDR